MASGTQQVFVVEDDDGMREAIGSLLDIAGYATVMYGSAEALLAEGRIADALCIVSDLRLPAMSGLDLLSELRSRGGCPPVIVVTAHDAVGTRNEALRRGAASYLPKPFAGTALLAAIREVSAPPKVP